MKIGVSSYSYSRLIHEGKMGDADIPAKAKAMGFDALEFSSLAVPSGVTTLDHAKRLRDAAGTAGIELVNYTIGADFLKGSNGDLDAEVKRLYKEVDIARVLGVKGMRHDATGGPEGFAGGRTFDSVVGRLAEGCRGVTAYAEQFGIRTMVENHGFFCQDSDRVEKLMGAVAHPNFGILVDIGNFACADESSLHAVGRLAPYMIHGHAKDFHIKSGNASNPGEGWFCSRGGNYLRGAIIGHGDIPLLQCLRILRRVKYDGVLSIEFEGMEDVLQGISISFANLRRLVQEAN